MSACMCACVFCVFVKCHCQYQLWSFWEKAMNSTMSMHHGTYLWYQTETELHQKKLKSVVHVGICVFPYFDVQDSPDAVSALPRMASYFYLHAVLQYAWYARKPRTRATVCYLCVCEYHRELCLKRFRLKKKPRCSSHMNGTDNVRFVALWDLPWANAWRCFRYDATCIPFVHSYKYQWSEMLDSWR